MKIFHLRYFIIIILRYNNLKNQASNVNYTKFFSLQTTTNVVRVLDKTRNGVNIDNFSNRCIAISKGNPKFILVTSRELVLYKVLSLHYYNLLIPSTLYYISWLCSKIPNGIYAGSTFPFSRRIL